MNPSILAIPPTRMETIDGSILFLTIQSALYGQTGFFNFGRATNPGEEKILIQTSCTSHKKLTLYRILLEVEGLGKYIY